jgi:hypothetical protein
MSLTPGSLVLGRELRLPCGQPFGASPDKERPTADKAVNLMNNPHVIHSYAREHLNRTSDWMKTRYSKHANYAGYHEGEKLFLSCLNRKRGK